jgi:hypothetical protein
VRRFDGNGSRPPRVTERGKLDWTRDRELSLVLTLAPSGSTAQLAWIDFRPGVSTAADVTQRFGQPKTLKHRGEKKILSYSAEALKDTGAREIQVTVGPNDVVERISVFPAQTVSRSVAVGFFGGPCAAEADPARCYRPEKAASGHDCFWYATQGLKIYFSPDGSTATSFVYLAAAPVAQPAKTVSPAPREEGSDGPAQ